MLRQENSAVRHHPSEPGPCHRETRSPRRRCPGSTGRRFPGLQRHPRRRRGLGYSHRCRRGARGCAGRARPGLTGAAGKCTEYTTRRESMQPTSEHSATELEAARSADSTNRASTTPTPAPNSPTRSTASARSSGSATRSSWRTTTSGRRSSRWPTSSATRSSWRARRHGDRRRGDRLLRRPLHGRDGEDPVARRRPCCCPTCAPAARSPTASIPTSWSSGATSCASSIPICRSSPTSTPRAAVKAVVDVCCTSANAVQIVEKLPTQHILFVPDEHLGELRAARDHARR